MENRVRSARIQRRARAHAVWFPRHEELFDRSFDQRSSCRCPPRRSAPFVPREAQATFPTLDVTLHLAREHAIVVAEAEGELGVANAQMSAARVSSLGNPYTEIQVDRPFSNGVGSAGESVGRQVQAMSWTYFPLDIAGQRGRRIEEAEQLIRWRKVGLVQAQSLAMGDAVSAYGELVVSTQRVVEANIGEVTAREEAKYFQGRFAAKDTTLFEKSVAEAEVARWVQAKAEAELRVAAARARFGQLTGVIDPESPPPNASVTPPPLRSPLDDTRVGRLAERSPVVSRFVAEKSYWESSIERYEREKIPPVAFEVIAGRGSQGEARFGAGAVVTFPVTRRFQGEIARAEHGRLHALRHLDLYRSVVVTRLRAAREAIASITKALDELDKNGIPALERAVETSVEGFRAGKIDLTRAMLARRDLAIARARRLDIIEASWRAYADLVIFSGELP
jgi:outer membrane protein, heavy metal efflux system